MSKTLGYIMLAKATMKDCDEPLEVNWLETTDEYVVNRGETIIADGLTEGQAQRLLDFLEGECEQDYDFKLEGGEIV